MTAKEKRETYALIENGEADIIIGTHALIQEKVKYKNLALVVTDEQHRFGVRQREIISAKGENPHVMVMSATPIPRTLAIIMYGDLDISIIDELPSDRKSIANCVVGTDYRYNAYKFMEQQISQGRQVYVICPTVEYSEAVEGENVIEYAEKLKQIFPGSIHVEYLHGRMKASEKNDIMDRFAANEIQVLVSTTVVEVGVNVPNATVMMVENAERFGLAQLHQLRGRVGRGKHQSYCIFINGSGKKEAAERLEILNQSNDGFFIANEDLKLRGPGDFFGVRQSGDFEFRIGNIMNDAKILKDAAKVLAPAGYDIELVEKHHNQKLDAPSGTALALADSVNEALGNEYHYVYDRSTVRQKRDAKEIGISALRGGTIVGEHEVIFAGTDEVIEFKHTAYSRSVFGKGAVEAAKFLAGKESGMYDMSDVVGL